MNAQDQLILAGKFPLSGLHLHLAAQRTEYELGERIPITMRYTYGGQCKLKVHVPTYDRSGRIPYFEFKARDASGHKAEDPTPFMGGIMGGISINPPLSKNQSHTQTVDLNEWLRFDHPGRYTITLRTTTVQFDEPEYQKQSAVLPLDSDRLTIEIVPPVDAHRLERIARARTALDSSEESDQQAAMRDLRCMVDTRAIPLLVRGLESNYGNVQIEATFGLRTFPDMRKVQEELLTVLHDSSRSLSKQQAFSYPALLAEADVKGEGHSIDKDYMRYREFYDKWEGAFEQALTLRAKGKSDLFIISYQEEVLRRCAASGQLLGDLAVHDGKPNSIAVDLDGEVYVAFGEKGMVRKYASDGRLIGVITDPLFVVCNKLACDARGNLYVAGMNTIHRFSPTGANLGMFIQTDVKVLNNVGGMAFDAKGNLFAADTNGVQQFSSEGRYLGSWPGASGMLADGLAFGTVPAL